MNERIRELARRVVGKHRNDVDSISLFDEQIEQFAELVWMDGYKDGMNMILRAQLDNPIFSKAMDEHYESKWAHRFD